MPRSVAIAEAATRPTRRFVWLKSKAQLNPQILHRVRERLVKGRDLAAWVGLTPRQHSTGGNTKMLGISKRGNGYLPKQLIHGARAAMPHLPANPNQLGAWLQAIVARLWLDMALASQSHPDERICNGKKAACRYFFDAELPQAMTWLTNIASGSEAASRATAAIFDEPRPSQAALSYICDGKRSD